MLKTVLGDSNASVSVNRALYRIYKGGPQSRSAFVLVGAISRRSILQGTSLLRSAFAFGGWRKLETHCALGC